MITIFNRKELCITYSMEEQAKIRDVLSSYNIDYSLSTLGNLHISNSRGVPGMQDFTQTQYKFYVKKSDYEEAIAILNGKV
ncbi:hypothetical protein [Anaerotignum sp. MB30-C6]|uniref:hypothetical protein n=1 Tax=Anaerotignum sp. MB30-C6 TaxID=3070814 RepID=UPI0027DB3EAA|nr:hypothetical protein [Anaerotignum sp. MB30-C6]WMI81701.1 hypothetical protein RBQ60_02880 [Anaerotignum sp. MB30-C6]